MSFIPDDLYEMKSIVIYLCFYPIIATYIFNEKLSLIVLSWREIVNSIQNHPFVLHRSMMFLFKNGSSNTSKGSTNLGLKNITLALVEFSIKTNT